MLRKILIPLAFLLAFAAPALAQNVRHDDTVYSRYNNPAPGAFIAACTQPATITSSAPYCSPIAPLCSSLTDASCTQPNPVTTDGLGNYHFYIPSASLPITLCIYGSTLPVPTLANGGCLPDQSFGGGGSSGGGNLTGSGTPGTLSIWAGPTTLGNSTITSNTGGYVLDTATTGITGASWALSPSGLTVNPNNNIGGAGWTLIPTPVTGAVGTTVQISGGATNGTNFPGPVQINGGSNSFNLGANLDIGTGISGQGGPSSSGNGGFVDFFGGASSSGRGGDIELEPGLGYNAANNGVIRIGQNSSTNDPRYIYLANVSFANLAAPSLNPGPSIADGRGAMIFCQDCQGPQDGGAAGAVATGGGTGAQIKYLGGFWRNTDGLGGSGGGGSAFSAITTGTNTSAAMVAGSGSSLVPGGGQLTSNSEFFGTASLGIAPSPVGTSTCPSGSNPLSYTEDAGGTYQTQAAIDPNQLMSFSATKGYLVQCRPTIFNMSGTSSGIDLNGVVNYFGLFNSPESGLLRQAEYTNPAGDTTTYTVGNLSAEYDEMYINGTPTINTTYVSTTRERLDDIKTGGSKPRSWSVFQATASKLGSYDITNCTGGIIGEVNGACYVGYWGQAYAGLSSTESESGATYAAFEGFVEDIGNHATSAVGMAFHATHENSNGDRMATEYGFYSENFGAPSSGWYNFYSVGTATTGENFFGGLTIFGTVSQHTPAVFSTFPSCSSTTEGMEAVVSDSTTNVVGATITGGGSDVVLGFCNGSNWTVGTGSASGSGSPVTAANGGTGLNTSSSTGVAQVLSGTWSVSTTLPNGITGTTQSANDNSTKLATTGYVDTGLGLKLNAASGVFTGTPNASGATEFKMPVAAGFATLANGELGYDSTNKNWHFWQNGADVLGATFSGSIVNGDCAQIQISSNVVNLVDAGGACGTSSMVYPGAGLAISTGSAWASSISETDGDIIFGAASSWTKGTALPNGITGTTQTALSDDTKIATDAYVDGHYVLANTTAVMPTGTLLAGTCSSVVTTSASGVLTSDVVRYGFNGDPTTTAQLNPANENAPSIIPFPGANTANVKYCNYSPNSITLGALTLNLQVYR